VEIGGKTEIVGIFGYPVEHTLSPRMHNAAFRELRLDMLYVAYRVSPEDLPEAVQAIKVLNMRGVNITIPHKERAIPLMDRVDEEAAFIGAINTVVHSNGILKGYNTDGRGFISSLSEAGITPDEKDICIIGAGGAARAISYYLSQKAKRVTLHDIDLQKARKLFNDLARIRENVFLLDDIGEIGKPDMIINATPLGLKPDDPLPLQPDVISRNTVVCDLVYKKTAFLKEAAKRGATTLDGSGMLLWQGVLAFELWTGIKPPHELMRKVLLSSLQV
jgi:shikimate dehydrogenase